MLMRDVVRVVFICIWLYSEINCNSFSGKSEICVCICEDSIGRWHWCKFALCFCWPLRQCKYQILVSLQRLMFMRNRHKSVECKEYLVLHLRILELELWRNLIPCWHCIVKKARRYLFSRLSHFEVRRTNQKPAFIAHILRVITNLNLFSLRLK